MNEVKDVTFTSVSLHIGVKICFSPANGKGLVARGRPRQEPVRPVGQIAACFSKTGLMTVRRPSCSFRVPSVSSPDEF